MAKEREGERERKVDRRREGDKEGGGQYWEVTPDVHQLHNTPFGVLATKQPAALPPRRPAPPTYILGSGTLKQTFSALRPCISLWMGSFARLQEVRRGLRCPRGGLCVTP